LAIRAHALALRHGVETARTVLCDLDALPRWSPPFPARAELHAAYEKLGVQGRAELARTLETEGD
jgi:hypothetical protein